MKSPYKGWFSSENGHVWHKTLPNSHLYVTENHESGRTYWSILVGIDHVPAEDVRYRTRKDAMLAAETVAMLEGLV
jgi:hypothetical protein